MLVDLCVDVCCCLLSNYVVHSTLMCACLVLTCCFDSCAKPARHSKLKELPVLKYFVFGLSVCGQLAKPTCRAKPKNTFIF